MALSLNEWRLIHKRSLRWTSAALGVSRETLRLWEHSGRDPNKIFNNPVMAKKIWALTKGDVSVGGYRPKPACVKVTCNFAGEIPKSHDNVVLMRQTFGNRVAETKTGYTLDGRSIPTKNLYQQVNDILKRDGSPHRIKYPGIV